MGEAHTVGIDEYLDACGCVGLSIFKEPHQLQHPITHSSNSKPTHTACGLRHMASAASRFQPPGLFTIPVIAPKMPPSVLIVGGSRGLGASLGKQYAAKCWNVFATCREFEFDGVPRPGHHPDIHWVVGVDLLRSDVGDGIVRQLRQYGGRPWLDVVASTSRLLSW